MTDKQLIATIRTRAEQARHRAMEARQSAQFGPLAEELTMDGVIHRQLGSPEWTAEVDRLHAKAEAAEAREAAWSQVTVAVCRAFGLDVLTGAPIQRQEAM